MTTKLGKRFKNVLTTFHVFTDTQIMTLEGLDPRTKSKVYTLHIFYIRNVMEGLIS